jgi:DNA-binding response OmpR family regulator
LYVEDVDTNQYLIQNLLKGYHAKCDVASTGKQALILLAKKNYDLLLLDIQLPDISGYELLDIARSTLQAKSTPVIIFTADVTEATRIKILNQGIKDILYKPFITDNLLTKIIEVTKTREGVTMAYYERLFRANKVKLEKVKELIAHDLEELRLSLLKNVKDNNIVKVKKSIHKAKVVIKNINALKLLKLVEALESRKTITPYFMKKYRTVQRELATVKKKIGTYSF